MWMSLQSPLEVDKLEIITVIDNYFEGLLPSTEEVHRRGFLNVTDERSPSLLAEHGLSFLVKATCDGQTHSVIFDFGCSPNAACSNAQAMNADLSAVEALVLSHGHFDHFGGLAPLATLLPATAHNPLPLYLGREGFSRRHWMMPDGRLVFMGVLPQEQVRLLPLEPREVVTPLEIVPGILAGGEIPRRVPFEEGLPPGRVERDEETVRDTFPGEISLYFCLRGKGLVVLTGCAHAGIINTVNHAIECTGERKVYAILGGFHLTGAPPETIEATVRALTAFEPEIIVPMHCTGFMAMRDISLALPKAFVLNSSGTTYCLSGG